MANVDVYEQCRAAVADRLVALGLTNPATGQPLPVLRDLWDRDLNVEFPVLQVTIDGPEPEYLGLTCTSRTITYPVVVLFKARQEAGHSDERAAFYGGVFRDVQNALRSLTRLAGAPTVWRCRLEGLRHLDRREQERYQDAEHGWVLYCDSAEPVAGVPA
jgi:hypothetical protein